MNDKHKRFTQTIRSQSVLCFPSNQVVMAGLDGLFVDVDTLDVVVGVEDLVDLLLASLL